MDISHHNSQEESVRLKQNLSSEPGTQSKRQYPYSQSSSRFQTIRKRRKKQIDSCDSQEDAPKQWNDSLMEAEGNSKQLQAIQEQQSVISSDVPMRQKYSHLLPGYMGANYSIEHRKLFRLQTALDQVLQFLRDHRKKTKGAFFSVLKKSIDSFAVQIQNLKQIMFLTPHLYNCEMKQNEYDRPDICVSLPQIDEIEKKIRGQEFRKALYNYVMDHKHQYKNKIEFVKIPQCTFEFQKQEKKNREKVIESFKKNSTDFFSDSSKFFKSKINPFDAFKLGTNKFEEMLLTEIKEKQKKLNEQKEKSCSHSYKQKDVFDILNEIVRIYRKRDKTCMFKTTLLADLDKNLHYNIDIISKILDEILARYPNLLVPNQHPCGVILQLQKKVYREVAKKLEQMIRVESNVKEKLKKTNSQEGAGEDIKEDKDVENKPRYISPLLKKPTENIEISNIRPALSLKLSFCRPNNALKSKVSNKKRTK